MNRYETLFFPDSDIFREKRYPLLLFFTPLHFLQLVEPEDGGNSAFNQESDLFLQHGLCQAHTPAPLGENRLQFLRLIDDIRNRKEYYVAKLRAMTIGSETELTSNKTADQKHGIVSSLLQEYGLAHETDETNLELWQARLVFAIAEMLDSDEDALHEQLSEQLAFFNEEEIAVYRSLQVAKEDDLFSELKNIKEKLEKPRLSDTRTRFNAWLRLLKNQPLPLVKVWLASTRDSADQIFERYESISNSSARPLLKLAIPAYIDASGKYVVQQVEEFQQATTSIHEGLVADFERIVKTIPYLRNSHQSLLPYSTDWAEQWEGMLDDFFPESMYGRNDITFYLFPDQPLARMLALPQSAEASNDRAAHGLLGILGH
jgi:hypothetical protein